MTTRSPSILLPVDALVPLFATVGAILLSAIVMWVLGVDAFAAFAAIFSDSFATSYGFSETLVKATPILLCALAVAVPAWAGLTNVGAEGQLLIGGASASAVALTASGLSAAFLLPAMFVAAFLGGGVWAGGAAWLRARFGTSEVLVTLLSNFIALLLVEHLVYGPWRDPDSRGWPQSAEFVSFAVLPTLGFGRIHAGLLIALAAAFALTWFRVNTRWGARSRVIEANVETARYAGIPVSRYLFWMLVVGGGLAALAGASEASAIQGRLRAELSAGYGYTGILVAWMCRHNPIAIVFGAIFIGGLLAGGDTLQLTMGLPSATISITIGLMLFLFLIGDVLIRRLGKQDG